MKHTNPLTNALDAERSERKLPASPTAAPTVQPTAISDDQVNALANSLLGGKSVKLRSNNVRKPKASKSYRMKCAACDAVNEFTDDDLPDWTTDESAGTTTADDNENSLTKALRPAAINSQINDAVKRAVTEERHKLISKPYVDALSKALKR